MRMMNRKRRVKRPLFFIGLRKAKDERLYSIISI